MKNMMKLLVVLGLLMGSLALFAQEAASPSAAIGEQGTDCVQINTQTIEDDVIEDIEVDATGKAMTDQ